MIFLNYLNYAVKIATAKAESEIGRVCLAHPFHEKAMALAYKGLHADHFGEILCVNWIPPLFTHSAFKQGLYYLDEGKEILGGLVAQGVVESCGLQIAAEALEESSLYEKQTDVISAMIAGIGRKDVA